ncbi:MAG: porin [Limnohabitans sp.]|nr:porin [Limnohabitans sp.]
MKFKFSVSLLTLGLLGVSAQAQSSWEIYGRANVSLDQLDNGAGYKEFNLVSNASRLGFRGQKKFDSGLTGIWQLESAISITNDATSNQLLGKRDTFVGIQDAWGTLRVGHFDTPMKVARDPANLFGDQLGDMRNITRASLRFDERPNNLIEYKTPSFNGWVAAIAYAAHEGMTNTDPAVTTSSVAGQNGMMGYSLTYRQGNLLLAYAGESYENKASNGKRDGNRLAASYKVRPDLRLVGFFQKGNDKATATAGTANDKSATVTGYGLEYNLNPKSVIKFASFKNDAKILNGDSTQNALGFEHLLDKQMRVHVTYASVKNGTAAKVQPWVQGRDLTGLASASGATAEGLSVGLRYDF